MNKTPELLIYGHIYSTGTDNSLYRASTFSLSTTQKLDEKKIDCHLKVFV